ncbi:DUF4148 domain-containing protein [Paraburkholderia strydomiana]
MKFFRLSMALAALSAVSVLTSAQQVPAGNDVARKELVALERAGYNPHAKSNVYPADVQSTEAKIAATQSGVGSESVGHSESGGARVHSEVGDHRLYEHR